MNTPDHITPEARATAEWFVFNHTGEACDGGNEALISDLAQMLTDFRGSSAVPGLTKKQAEALQFIRAYQTANGFSPSYREIASRFSIGLARVHEMINALVARGAITMIPGRARSIALVDANRRVEDVSTAHKNFLEA